MKIYKISLVLIIACTMVGCAKMTDMLMRKSPTQTMRTFVEASMKKDVDGVKNSLSSGSLKMMEGLAKMQGKTLDQTIKEGDAGENEYKEVPEMRNEKIEGDTATLEVKNVKTGEWDTLYFVRETDEWKIALDKSIEEMLKKSLGDWKMPNFDDSDSTTDGDKPSTEKKP
jgi:hypothetical protein